MEKFMLIAEIVIGIMGLVMIIDAEKKHDIVHGIFVILLCIQGILDHILGVNHILSEFMLFLTAGVAAVAVFFIVRHLMQRSKDKRGQGK